MSGGARTANGGRGRWLFVAASALMVICVSCEPDADVAAPSPKPVPAAPEPPERIWIEAEHAARIDGNGMKVVEDEGASGGKCIRVTEWFEPFRNVRQTSAVYYFDVEKAGKYTFWCRRKWQDPPQDSETLALRFDQPGRPSDLESQLVFGSDDMGRPPRWGWSPVYEQGTPRQFFFAAGPHVLEMLNHWSRARFDAILLTNDPEHVPFGIDGRTYVPRSQPPDAERQAPSP